MSTFALQPWHAAALACFCLHAKADFVTDSRLDLELKNFFYDRDYHGPDARQSRRHEWAQGVSLDFQSGWTPGTLAVGLDLSGTLGLKLDSSVAQTGSGLLPRDSSGEPESNYSSAYPTLKARWGERHDMRLGQLSPQLPLLASNGSRLFPQRFRGFQYTGRLSKALSADALHIDQVKLRDSSGFEDMSLTPQGGSYDGNAKSSGLDYLGLNWTISSGLGASFHIQRLNDLMRRAYAGLKFTHPVGVGEAFGELRYFDAAGEGAEKAGHVDNRTLSTLVGYRWAGHSVSGGMQRGWGDTAYAYVNGSDTYLFSEQLVSTFGNPQERALHLRYDYDFAAVGIPGLNLNVRYVKGSDIDLWGLTGVKAKRAYLAGDEGREWERTLDLTYTVQDGPLKNVYVRWRNGHYQGNFADPADENRLTVGYKMRLW